MSAPPASPPPRRFQFRLGTLLGSMFWVGLACAALAMPTPFWAATILCLAIVSLLASILVAIYRTAGARAFAVGFLVFGGGYLAFVAGLDHGLRRYDTQAAMPTSRACSWAYIATHAQNRQSRTVQVSNFAPPAPSDPFGPGPTVAPTITTRVMAVPVHNDEDFIEISHSVLSMLLGFVGGIFAWFLYTTRRDDAAVEREPSTLSPK